MNFKVDYGNCFPIFILKMSNTKEVIMEISSKLKQMTITVPYLDSIAIMKKEQFQMA